MANRFYLGDPHVHSSLSDGRLTPAELALVAAARSLDFLALTDHGKRQSAPSPDLAGSTSTSGPVTFLSGQEVSMGGRIHFLLLGYDQPVPRGRFSLEQLDELAAHVHLAGGVVVLAHPWMAFAKSPDRLDLLDRGFTEGLLDGLEVFSAALYPSQFGLWRRMFDHYLKRWAPCRPAALASSDWHHRRHGRAIGLGCTYVLATDPTPAALLRGLRQRRTLAALQPAVLLEDGLFPTPCLPFPKPQQGMEVRWTDCLCGPADLVGELLALQAGVEQRLRAGHPAGRPPDGAGAELFRAALAAQAAGNYRRAAALLTRLGR
ncbi:MAG: CehA/McbA family metallohydrolase [Betaproteobacteria bacterium]